MSVYPNAIDGYNEIRVARDTLDTIIAADHNDLRSAVLAMEQTLGIKPQSTYGTVGQRSETLESNSENHYDGTSFRHVDGHVDSTTKTGSPFSLAAGTVQTQLFEVITNLDSSVRYAGSTPDTFADGYELIASFTTSAVTEIVNQIGGTTGSAKVGIDTSGWFRLHETPAPTSAQLVFDRTDEYMNSIYAEVEAARISPILSPAGGSAGGTFASLANHLIVADNHARTIISCTDGTTSIGGMFSGADALVNAIDTIDTLSDEYGGIILLRAGTYTIDSAIYINNSIQIIGVENDVIIEDRLGGASANWMVSFRGTESSIKNVSFVPWSDDPHYRHLRLEATNCMAEQISCDGTIGIGTLQSCYNCVLKNCDFGTLSGSIVDSVIIGDWSENAKVSQCTFTTMGHNLALDAYGGYFGAPALVENCFFTITQDAMAIRDNGNGGSIIDPGADDLTALRIKNCKILCQPSNANRPTVSVRSNSASIDGIKIDVVNLAGVDGYIRSSLLDVQGNDFYVNNVNINFRDDTHLFAYGADNNPLIFKGRGTVDGLIVKGGGLPTDGDGIGALSADLPLIWAAGNGTLDEYGVVYIKNADITCPTDTATAGDADFTLIGDVGSAGVAATLNGWIELSNIMVTGSTTNLWDDQDQKFVISNLQENSRVHECSFIGGGWTSVIFVVDVNDVQILNNRFEISVNQNCQNIIFVVADSVAVFRPMINGNHLIFDDLDQGSGVFGGITILGATDGMINNNIVTNTNKTPLGSMAINLDTGTERFIVMGNSVRTPDSGTYGINDSGSNNKYEVSGSFDLNLLSG